MKRCNIVIYFCEIVTFSSKLALQIKPSRPPLLPEKVISGLTNIAEIMLTEGEC